ncbi:MAG: hypothetical protein ABIE70_00690 [bacterium]
MTVMAAAVPPLVNYQGRLTDDSGDPVADGTYIIAFRVYAEAVDGTPLWLETHEVTTEDGLFTASLGDLVPISGIFDGSTRYLCFFMSGQPESTPRIPIISVPYALVAGSVDGASGDCADCDPRFVNQTGPETITASAETTLTIVNTGVGIKCGLNVRADGSNDLGDVYGLRASARNDGAGNFPAYGGLFQASGGNSMQYGVYGSATNNAPIFPVYGVYGHGYNASPDGDAYGGYFAAAGGDPSNHYGAGGYAHAESEAMAVGLDGKGTNSAEGFAIGGLFTAGGTGAGRHFGVKSFGYANGDSTATALYGYADNYGSGQAIGGEFTTGHVGAGRRYGVRSDAFGNSDSTTYGVYSSAANRSSGIAYGGYFKAPDSGTGDHYGLLGTAEASASAAIGLYGEAEGGTTARGLYTYASSDGAGDTWGGQFVCHGMGTGEARGVESYVLGGASLSTMYGVDAQAAGGADFEGTGYGGYFYSTGYLSAGNQYAVYGLAENYSNTGAFGVYGRGNQHGSGNTFGGYFITDSSGTGTSYGIRPVGLSKGSATAYGTASVAANRSTGVVYGGYFEMLNYGTGGGYGIFAKARTAGGPASWAGYFQGHVRVTDVLSVLGTKSATVKMDDGNYRNLYCQESPEIWFEDFGEGQLVDGRAHVELDGLFLQTVTIDEQHPLKVFAQLEGDCNGVFIANKSATGFDIVELQKGASNASFSYRVIAKRRGYENVRLDLMLGPTPEEVAAQLERDRPALIADEAAMEQDYLKRKEAEAQRAAEEPTLPLDRQ